MKARLVVVGSSNTDMTLHLPRLPRPGETVLGGDFAMAAGGKGANQAVAAARAGGSVTFVSRVGRDLFGDQAIAGFSGDGIDVHHVGRDAKAASGTALIFVAHDGQNCIGVAGGANGQLSAKHVQRSGAAIRNAEAVLMQLEIPLETVQAAADLAHKAGVRVILNPAPARTLPSTLLRKISILTPNEVEAEALTGIKVNNEESAERAAVALLHTGVGTIIITLGARGAFVATPDLRRRVPGFRMRAVDTVAAGDVFNGALAVALGESQPLLQAVQFANASAALSVTRRGAQPSAPQRGEIQELLRSRKRVKFV